MLLYRTESVDYLKDDSLFEQCYVRVPSYRKRKIDALKNPEDRRLSLGAELLLEKLLREAGFSELAETRDVELSERGKPYFLKRDSKETSTGMNLPFFCLSHSGERVMCALSDKPVGCDIEKATRSRSTCAALALRFFSAEEASAVDSASDENAVSQFYQLWTAKEAYAKCMDIPLPEALKRNQHDGNGMKLLQSEGDGYYWSIVYQERAGYSMKYVLSGGKPLNPTLA